MLRPSMRYMAIDLGDKRTGLAVGDDVTGIISPMAVLEIPRGDRLVEAIVKAIREHGAEAIVIGLPLNMDGSEGPQAKSAREFGQTLGQRSGLELQYQDERLSSFAAEEHLKQSGRTHQQKKQRRDALAAAEILRSFLSALK